MQGSSSASQGASKQGDIDSRRSSSGEGLSRANVDTPEEGQGPSLNASVISSAANIAIKASDEAAGSLILKEMLAWPWKESSLKDFNAHYKHKYPTASRTQAIVSDNKAYFQAHCPGYRSKTRGTAVKLASTQASPDSDSEGLPLGPSSKSSSRLAGGLGTQTAPVGLAQTDTETLEKRHHPGASSGLSGRGSLKLYIQGQPSTSTSACSAAESSQRGKDATPPPTSKMHHSAEQVRDGTEAKDDGSRARSDRSTTAQPTTETATLSSANSTALMRRLQSANREMTKAVDAMQGERQGEQTIAKRNAEELGELKEIVKRERKERVSDEAQSNQTIIESEQTISRLQKELVEAKGETATVMQRAQLAETKLAAGKKAASDLAVLYD